MLHTTHFWQTLIAQGLDETDLCGTTTTVSIATVLCNNYLMTYTSDCISMIFGFTAVCIAIYVIIVPQTMYT